MRKDSCIYAKAGVYSPNILIRAGQIKYLLGVLRVRKEGPVLCCREDPGWRKGSREEDVGSLRVSRCASRCHHLKAFGSGESVRRVDLKCPLCIHTFVHANVRVVCGRERGAPRVSYSITAICMPRISFACINSLNYHHL